MKKLDIALVSNTIQNVDIGLVCTRVEKLSIDVIEKLGIGVIKGKT